MLLPAEIRRLIYSYLIPKEDDICINYGFDRAVKRPGCDSHTDCYAAASIRKDGGKCHTAILAVNRQVYAESSTMMYARTYTITISIHRTASQGCGVIIESPGDWKELLQVFPIHRIKALRLRVLTPPKPTPIPFEASFVSSHTWFNIYEKLNQVMTPLEFASGERGLMKSFIIDVSEPCCFPPSFPGVKPCMADLRSLFSLLSQHLCGLESCIISLPLWAKNCPDIIQVAKDCGRAMTSSRDCFSCNKTKTEKATSQHFGMQPVVQVKDLVMGDGTRETPKPTITE